MAPWHVLLDINKNRSPQGVSAYSHRVRGRGVPDSPGSAPRPSTSPSADGGECLVPPKGGGAVDPTQWGRAGRGHAPPLSAFPLSCHPRRHAPSRPVAVQRCASETCSHFLGPRSTCGQSSGMRLSGSTGPPPPQRRPLRKATFPHWIFMNSLGMKPREMSTPVAGQLRWVERSSAAVGRP